MSSRGEKTTLQPTDPHPPRMSNLPLLLAVWCSFFVYSVVVAPIPAVNEPHYLCKSKNFWQPDWCANDFFLQSSNAHTVFYATIGILTRWFTLEQTAWIGRVLASCVLAAGWCSLMAAVSNPPASQSGDSRNSRWFALHVCWGFLFLASWGNFSGEWLVGGVEGKVFSYGFLFGAFGQLEQKRLIRAGALTGLAIAFHPVIGVWGLLAVAGSQLFELVITKRLDGSAAPFSDWKNVSIAFVVLIVCALPGLIPVFRLLAEPAPEAVKAAATFIQVYFRLAHHLDPMRFLPQAYLGYGALIAAWVLGVYLNRPTEGQRRFYAIVAMAIMFALAGLIVGWGPRPATQMPLYELRGQLLKFYPFRLTDVLVPMAVSVAAASWLANLKQVRVRDGVQTAAFGILFSVALLRAHAAVEPSRYSGKLYGDWTSACHWVDQHLPADALVHTPHKDWSFKWSAHRAEYVAFKDCPQDAKGIVEWNNRLNFLKRWFETHYADKLYSADELRELRAKTKITHIFTDHLGPMELEPVYRNETFQVYDLTTLDR